jgi:UDP-N-acetylmuramoyl-tripeptide--D-alanyl-D-alanine ligase
MNLTLKEVAVMCGGELSNHSKSDLSIKHVVINSLDAKASSLFAAIKGETHDGHDFVANILKNDSCAALVGEDYLQSQARQPQNLIYVKDVIKALGRFAGFYRDRFEIPLVGITGSNGKTTVKEMLKSICIEQFGEQGVLANTGNLNNHLGVPLTLFGLKKQQKVAIIEMGMNHHGELDYLSRMAKPTIAVVNNVMLAHAGFFHDLTDIARAKGEIYYGLKPGGVACINLADKQHPIWDNDISKTINTRYTFGVDGSSCYLKNGNYNGEICIATTAGDIHTKLQVLGQHNQTNAVTATALAINLGCSLDSIEKGLANYAGYKGRLQQKTAFNGALIIDDSYNANPDSVKAAILAIAKLPKPHWLIFGDMGELGHLSQNAHIEIGKFAYKHKIDKLLTVGELAKYANDVFSGDKLHFATNQDIIEYCIKNLPTNTTVLIKGSKSTNLGSVVDKVVLGK